tara:strand:- start:938 stop:1345 length:408 start_codon:yes stop_codon:yes gene_type:complete
VSTEEMMTNEDLKILIVDDNLELAETLGMMVEMIDCDYTLAHNGADAIRIANELQPHIILLDIGLPDMSGHDVARELTQNSSLSHTLLVAQTGRDLPSDIQKTQEAGFHQHLVKPVGITHLEELIAQYINSVTES